MIALRVQGVGGDHAIVEIEVLEQGLEPGDLVGVAVHVGLCGLPLLETDTQAVNVTSPGPWRDPCVGDLGGAAVRDADGDDVDANPASRS